MTRQNRLCFARLENKAGALENNGKEIASPLSPLKGGLCDLQVFIVCFESRSVLIKKNNVKHLKPTDYDVPPFREVPVGRRIFFLYFCLVTKVTKKRKEVQIFNFKNYLC